MKKFILPLLFLSIQSCSKSEERPFPRTSTIIEGSITKSTSTSLNRPLALVIKGMQLNGFKPSIQTFTTTATLDTSGRYKLTPAIPPKTTILTIDLVGISFEDSVQITINDKSFEFRGFSEQVNSPTSMIKVGESNEMNFKIFTRKELNKKLSNK